MFTDMVGFTALTQKNESAALQLLEEHRGTLRPIFAEHAGSVVKTIGDAFLVEFSSVLDATKCAVKIQKTLHDLAPGASGDRRIQVRIGIHLGDVVHKQGDVYGDAVNIASRIEPLAEPGGICVSEQVYYQVRNKVGLSFTSLGKRELKNVEAPLELYRVELPWEKQEEMNEEADVSRIAVLPFVNISPDPKDEYFADGLTEEMISTISNISDLSVISRTSVMSYRGTNKKVRDIGRELDAGSVLEGSVRKANDRMRITVQLIDVRNDRHLWAQSYDRQLDDVFAIQSDIANRVADALKVKILPDERQRLRKRPTSSTEAYTLYLKGRYFWNERKKESLFKAIKFFEGAIELDPNYALAHAGISDCYSVLGDHGYLPHSEAFSGSLRYAAKAVELDDSSAEAHTSLASSLAANWDWEGSEREFRRALELNPNYATAHQWYGILLTKRRRLDESLKEALRAQELDPLSPIINIFCGLVYSYMKNYDLAEKQIKKTLEFDPNFLPAHFNLWIIYLVQGRFAEAEKEVREFIALAKSDATTKQWLAAVYAFAGKTGDARKVLEELGGGVSHDDEGYVSAQGRVLTYLGLGEKEKAIALIEKEYEVHADWLTDMPVDRLYASVISEPRVVAVLRKIGLTD